MAAIVRHTLNAILLIKMERSDAIKQYKSPKESDGSYRVYSVFVKENQFVFDCWDCKMNNQAATGSRKT